MAKHEDRRTLPHRNEDPEPRPLAKGELKAIKARQREALAYVYNVPPLTFF